MATRLTAAVPAKQVVRNGHHPLSGDIASRQPHNANSAPCTSLTPSPMSADNTTAKNINESQSEKSHSSTGPENSGKKPARATFWQRLPPWVTTNLLSSRSRKTWLRCWLASWVCYVIILPNASLKVLGNACVFCSLCKVLWTDPPLHSRAFFALLASVMIPPNVPVQLFVFVRTPTRFSRCSLTCGIGSRNSSARIVFGMGSRVRRDAWCFGC